MRLLDLLFPERRNSAVVARDRLKIVLAHERASRDAPVFLPARVCLNIKDAVDGGGAWEESEFVGWNPSSGRRHFRGTVTRL